MENKRQIIHVDMDAFFAQIEQRDNPGYKNKPLIVGGPVNRGVISSASYEARAYGLHSGMPLYKAKKLCPRGIYVPVNMEKYLFESRIIRNIFYQFTPLVEPIGCDEAFLDVTGCEKLFGKVFDIAKKIKGAIYEKTNLISSAGIGSNKFFAKLASNLGKPNGLTVLENTPEIMSRIKMLPVSAIWGIGRSTEESLNKMGIKSMGDLASMPLEILKMKFKETGEFIYKMANGIDNRSVMPPSDPKSIGREITLSKDTSDISDLRIIILRLIQKIVINLGREKCKGRTITVKIRFSDFTGTSSRITISKYTDNIFDIFKIVLSLIQKIDLVRKKVRMIGISVSGLKKYSLIEYGLFEKDDKKDSISKTMYEINSRYGNNKIFVAESINEINE